MKARYVVVQDELATVEAVNLCRCVFGGISSQQPMVNQAEDKRNCAKNMV